MALNFDALIDFKTKDFVGRGWLVQEVEKWRKSPSSGGARFLVEAEPGCGKTAFAAHYMRYVEARGALIAKHFCRYDDVSTVDSLLFIQVIGEQIGAWLGSTGIGIPNTAMKALDTSDWTAFLEALHDLEPSRQDGVIVVDSLDEAEEGGGSLSIVPLLQKTLPPWMRIVATSRPATGRDGWKKKVIETEGEQNMADLKLWLGGKHDALLASSGGNFLYCRLALQEGLEETGELPQGLAGLYTARIQRAKVNIQHAQTVLDVLVAAVGWCPLSVVVAASRLTLEDVEAVIVGMRCGIARDAQDAVRFFHKSFGDWALETGLGRPADAESGHVMLAMASIDLWRGGSIYAVRNGVHHAVSSGDPGLQEKIWYHQGRFWDWMSAKAGLDGWDVVGRELMLLGGSDALLAGKIVKQWMYGGDSAVADGLAMHGTDEMQGEISDIVRVRPVCGSTPMPKSLDARLIGHTDAVNAIKALPDNRVVTGSSDGSLRIWDVRSGRSLLVLHGHNGPVNAVAYRSSGVEAPQIISGGDDMRLVVHDAESSAFVQDASAHFGAVLCIDTLSTGEIVSGASDRTVIVWFENVYDNRLAMQHRLRGHDGWVMDLCVLGQQVFSVGADKRMIIWEKQEGGGGWKYVSAEPRHDDWVSSIVRLDDGRIATGSDDKTILVQGDGRKRLCLSGHTDGVLALAAFRGSRLASGGRDVKVILWELPDDDTFMCLAVLRGHTGLISSLEVFGVWPNITILSASRDEQALIWRPELRTGVAFVDESKPRLGHQEPITCAALISDGRIVTGGVDGLVIIWKPVVAGGSPTVEAVIEAHENWLSVVRSPVLSEDILSGCDGGLVKLWRYDAGAGAGAGGGSWKAKITLRHVTGVKAVAGMVGGTIVTGTKHDVTVWNDDGGVRHDFDMRGESLVPMSSTQVVVGSSRGVIVLNTDSGAVEKRLESSGGFVSSLCLVDGGKAVLAGARVAKSLVKYMLEEGTAVDLDLERKLVPDCEADGHVLVHRLGGRCVEMWDYQSMKTRKLFDVVHVEDDIIGVFFFERNVIVVGQHNLWVAYAGL